MTEENSRGRAVLYPFALAIVLLVAWHTLSGSGRLPQTIFPTPFQVWQGFVAQCRNGLLFEDITTSLFRVAMGFVLAVTLGVPLGLLMGNVVGARLTLLPYVNFFRSISAIAWLGFAIAWFPLGDPATIFLIFQSAFWPLALGTLAAASGVPSIYYRVARDYGFTPFQKVTRITFPAILPQLLSNLRITMGLVWTVIVPAEMVAGRSGLGFRVQDDRNGLRVDLLVVHMIVIGIIGVILDRLLVRLTRLPNVRWGYER